METVSKEQVAVLLSNYSGECGLHEALEYAASLPAQIENLAASQDGEIEVSFDNGQTFKATVEER